MKKPRLLFHRTFPVLLFLIAFLPRAVQPVSRPLVWYLRSAHFVDAMLAGDWANTVYSEHPGVALMWPVGISLKVYWLLSGITPASEQVPPDFEPIHFFGPVPVAEIAAAVVPLALLIALGILGAYFLLRRLFDGATAAVAALLLAVSPYYLAQSKILQLDAWMATLMLLSALTLLLHRRERRFRWLLFSGFLGGLALLVKSAALFLIPFSGLALLVHAIQDTQDAMRNKPHVSRIVHSVLRSLFLPLVIWLLVAALVYAALWPAMWVEPGRALAAVKWGLAKHASTAHDTPTFFLGRVTREDPGPLLYGVALLFHTSEVTLVFLAVAAILGVAYLRRRRRLSPRGVDALFLLAYAVFFLIQMSLGAKKMPRYVLPAVLALDILAAAAIVAWARGLAGARRGLACILMALPLLVQAALILPRHPTYGTAFNWLAGGPPAAARSILIGEEGEGYAEMTATLNTQPGTQDNTVAAQLKHVFNQTFRGETVDIDQPADYVAFHRNYTVRDYKMEQWGALWERYAARTPQQEISFDGVPYAWLYAVLSPNSPPEHESSVRLGERYRFAGYDLRFPAALPGDRIPVVLYWEATEPASDDLSIFFHLLNADGELVWQDDGAAQHGARPTWSWGADEVIVDPHTLALPRDFPIGTYQLVTGLYDWQTGERKAALTSDGERLPQDQVTVATLTVRQPPLLPAVWVAWALAVVVVLSSLAIARRSNA